MMVICNKKHICMDKDCYHYNPHYHERNCLDFCSEIAEMTDCISNELPDFLTEDDMEI
jgi:hypothetical protein